MTQDYKIQKSVKYPFTQKKFSVTLTLNINLFISLFLCVYFNFIEFLFKKIFTELCSDIFVTLKNFDLTSVIKVQPSSYYNKICLR